MKKSKYIDLSGPFALRAYKIISWLDSMGPALLMEKGCPRIEMSRASALTPWLRRLPWWKYFWIIGVGKAYRFSWHQGRGWRKNWLKSVSSSKKSLIPCSLRRYEKALLQTSWCLGSTRTKKYHWPFKQKNLAPACALDRLLWISIIIRMIPIH